jgi:hypothetical protein
MLKNKPVFEEDFPMHDAYVATHSILNLINNAWHTLSARLEGRRLAARYSNMHYFIQTNSWKYKHPDFRSDRFLQNEFIELIDTLMADRRKALALGWQKPKTFARFKPATPRNG